MNKKKIGLIMIIVSMIVILTGWRLCEPLFNSNGLLFEFSMMADNAYLVFINSINIAALLLGIWGIILRYVAK